MGLLVKILPNILLFYCKKGSFWISMACLLFLKIKELFCFCAQNDLNGSMNAIRFFTKYTLMWKTTERIYCRSVDIDMGILQGRIFSYSDTQRYRLGTNYHQIPINRPLNSPAHNYQRDGPKCGDENQGVKSFFPLFLHVLCHVKKGPLCDQTHVKIITWKYFWFSPTFRNVMHCRQISTLRISWCFRQPFSMACYFLLICVNAILRRRRRVCWLNVVL